MFKKLTILIIAVLLTCIPLNYASANSAPVKYKNSTPGFNVVIDKENRVRIVNENLNFEIKDEKNLRSADISVEYTVINDGPTQDMYVVFPYLGNGDIKSYLDGKEIKYEFQRMTGININTRGDDVKFEDKYGNVSYTLDDVLEKILNGVSVPNGDDPDGYSVRAAFFKVPLEQGKTQSLKFVYSERAGEIKPKGFLKSTEYNYDYLIEPAKYWSDFKGFNLTIKVPKDIKINSSTLELNKNSEAGIDVYTYKSDTLPDKNLRFMIDSGAANPFGSIFITFIGLGLILAGIAALITIITLKVVYRKKRNTQAK